MLYDHLKISQNSAYNMSELYKNMVKWLEFYEYNYHETGYEVQNVGSDAKNIKFYWFAEKPIDEYIRFVIELNCFLIGVKKGEIDKNGVKMKAEQGTIEFRFNVYLEKDYNGKWGKIPMLTTLYDKFIARKRIDTYQGELLTEANKLFDEIKAFLNLHHN